MKTQIAWLFFAFLLSASAQQSPAGGKWFVLTEKDQITEETAYNFELYGTFLDSHSNVAAHPVLAFGCSKGEVTGNGIILVDTSSDVESEDQNALVTLRIDGKIQETSLFVTKTGGLVIELPMAREVANSREFRVRFPIAGSSLTVGFDTAGLNHKLVHRYCGSYLGD